MIPKLTKEEAIREHRKMWNWIAENLPEGKAEDARMNDNVYKFNCYWTEKMKIEFLQRVILIHSYLYYEKDSPVWSDKKYDDVAKQLVELQREHNRNSIKYNTQYGYALYDFDGTTGFDLWDRLNRKDKRYISNIAERMRYESKREKENGTKWKQETLKRIWKK